MTGSIMRTLAVVAVACSVACLSVGCARAAVETPSDDTSSRVVSVEVHDANGAIVTTEIESTSYADALSGESRWTGSHADGDPAYDGRWWFVDALSLDGDVLTLEMHRDDDARRVAMRATQCAIVDAGGKLGVDGASGVFCSTQLVSSTDDTDAVETTVQCQLIVDSATFESLAPKLETGVTVS